MIKRTLDFSTPGTLRLHHNQLVWKGEDGREATVPIEDIGLLLIDSPLITLSSALMQALSDACTAVVFCDATHHPSGYLLPQTAHTLVGRYLRAQIALSPARANRLWQQIICAKITNQAIVLSPYAPEAADKLRVMAGRVRRGDPENLEAQAARLYFSSLPIAEDFHRERYGSMPNAALNYGYSVLRAAVARALVASGVNPALGLHHRNQYNHFSLADDMMEPYRPSVDQIILDHLNIFSALPEEQMLTPEGKRHILPFLTMDMRYQTETRPLWNFLQRSTASLVKCLSGEAQTLLFPTPL
mgnify:CR=1 FL=1